MGVLAVLGEFDQGRQGDVLGIDLEEATQFLAGFAAAEAVGAENHVGGNATGAAPPAALTPGPSPKGRGEMLPPPTCITHGAIESPTALT